MTHTTTNTTHLSSLWSLEAFILDALGSLGGVERLEGELGGVGGSAGLVGTLLRLYLDGCLFSCKCSRLSYLEFEFRLQVIISALYYMSVCLESSI